MDKVNLCECEFTEVNFTIVKMCEFTNVYVH